MTTSHDAVLRAGDGAVGEWLAKSGRALPALRAWAVRDPQEPLAVALWAYADAERLGHQQVRTRLQAAHAAAVQAGNAHAASLIHAVWLAAHNQHRATADHLVLHLAQHPGDVLAGPLLSAFSLSGDLAYRDHGRNLAVTQYEAAGQESWPWASWAAAALAEMGESDRAWHLAGHALTLQPRSGTAVHARAHAEHEQGTGPAYTSFIDGWLKDDPRALQRRHLQWHAALQDLACGNLQAARLRADTELHRGDVGMRAATNWRLLLAGQAPANTSDLDHIHQLVDEGAGWAEVFHTFQLALALAVASDTDGLNAMAARAGGDRRPDYHQVLTPVIQALAHMTDGQPGKAVDLLTPLGQEVERVGGVRVEREIIQDTLARALIDTGQMEQAAHLLHHRVIHRHHHTYETLLLTPRTHALPHPTHAPADSPAARTCTRTGA
ncbi:hypothetical protein [Streptomyces aureocirculatus]|uniref:hypothetical protein n=1 Tax=Streptomyces aureocirculatus TaxID=67275 RepID=UPI0007C55887|nr:hypothetical protein [Streptomyces aureocirculatus]